MKLSKVAQEIGALIAHPCPNGHPDHHVVQANDDALAELGLPRGAFLHIDPTRKPRNGEIVLVELLRGRSMERLVRRYDESRGIVTLSMPGRPSIMRHRTELMVLGVVDRVDDLGATGRPAG